MGAPVSAVYADEVRAWVCGLMSVALIGCAGGAEGKDGLFGDVGGDGADHGQATDWDQGESSSDGDTTVGDADIDELDTSDGASESGSTGEPDVDGDTSSSGSESTEDTSDDGAPVGDPQCPPGFVVGFDVTDAAMDQLGNHCGWLPDVLLDESDRISFEVWSTTGDHYGPVIFDLSGYASAIEDFGNCSGPVAGVVSEDTGWHMWLIPSDSYLFLTEAYDDPQIPDTHLYGWLANEHVSDDEIFGIDEPYPGAWSTRYESGDRWVGCYDPAS